MGSRLRSIHALYTKTKRARRASFVTALGVLSVFAALVACGDSDDDSGGSLVNASSSGYVPATPATMPKVPPGAGPSDAGRIPTPMPDTGPNDGSTTDVMVITDSGSPTDAPPG